MLPRGLIYKMAKFSDSSNPGSLMYKALSAIEEGIKDATPSGVFGLLGVGKALSRIILPFR